MTPGTGLPLCAAACALQLGKMGFEYQMMLTLGEHSGPIIQEIQSSDSLLIWIEGMTKEHNILFFV